MNTALQSIVGLSFVALASLAGCATDVENANDGADEPVVAKPSEEGANLAPATISTGGGTACTTTKSCDANYCCTTEECQYSTFITCVPAPKPTTKKVAAFAVQ